ncbi:hypothetical protein [Candidatus Frankia nodulisporulans]|uniref:hypothetical protein n=1 Tax=Candidatus Frankia nodulisporulans TaxID=2060052 RepID=UPI0013D3083F|nr:hypothetical protein [Candidatus Frankia nodulisporulans]
MAAGLAGGGLLLRPTAALAAIPTRHLTPTILDPRTQPTAYALSAATGVNAAGEVTGWYGAQGLNAFTWTSSRGLRLLREFGARATGINAQGQIIGRLEIRDRPSVGFVYRDDRITLLPTGFIPIMQNDRGQVVGNADGPDVAREGLLLWENGIITDLARLLPSYRNGVPIAINNAGQILASFSMLNGLDILTGGGLYDNGLWRDLGVLVRGRGISTYPRALGEDGVVVGGADTGARNGDGLLQPTPFRWEDGQLTDLGDPGPQQRGATASALNRHGQILIDTEDFRTGATYLWDAGTAVQISPDGGPLAFRGYALTDSGIALYGRIYTDNAGFAWRGGVSAWLDGINGFTTSQYRPLWRVNESGLVAASATWPPNTPRRAAVYQVPATL